MAFTMPRPILTNGPGHGGILMNGDSPPLAPPGGGYGQRGRPPAIQIVPSDPAEVSPTDDSFSGGQGSSPRIRFAPLPEPQRPRSLSTGRNLGLLAGEGPNGERQYSLELQHMDSDNEHAVDDDDAESEGSGGGYDSHGRRRSWVSTMGMGSMSSKMHMGSMGSLLGMNSSKKSKKEDELGAPLKKTTSIPTSPFKSTGGGDSTNKKSSGGLLGTSPGALGATIFMGGRGPIAGPSTAAAHRRAGSGDATSNNPKVRMLNGRVYGARRASEAAAAEEMRRRQMEPDFVEWGNNKESARLGSSLGRGVDDDDGGGMAWVRKRREERERREREEREAREREEAENPTAGNGDDQARTSSRPASLTSSASSSSGAARTGPLTPHEPPAELFAPSIEVTPPSKTESPMPRHPQPTPAGENDHVVHAISIPTGSRRHDSMEQDGMDDDDEEDDGDFENDDDDEDEDFDASRFTCSAAGVEILSRHKK